MLLVFVVVQRAGPCVRDVLAVVRLEADRASRNQLADRLAELLGREADTSQVVNLALQVVRVGLQKLNRRLNAIVNVHHGELSVLFQEALVVTLLEQVEEDLRRVVSRAVEGVLGRRDDSRVAQRAEVHVVLVSEVLTRHFIENFAHTVNSRRLQNRVNGRLILLKDITAEDSNS